MTKETQSTTVSATASQADVTDVVPATEGENASAAQPDVNAQITAAVAAENSRIMGILNCEEAHGREEQARVLAETPGKRTGCTCPAVNRKRTLISFKL